MGYRLDPRSSIKRDTARIAEHQLALAAAALAGGNDVESDGAVHSARRRVKKVRALIRLVRPALGRRYRTLNRRLRAVNRLLAPVADTHAALETLERLARRHGDELPRDVFAELHQSLVRRASMARERTILNRALEAAIARLRRERDDVSRWTLRKTGFRAIAGGLERTLRQSRRAMAQAAASGRSDDYHTWRQRVKDHWLQTRLLQGRCGDRRLADERRLEELDGVLGECHNCAILRDAVRSDSTPARADLARCLRLVRRYEHSLRRAARQLGAKVYRDTPTRYVKRVRRLWRSSGSGRRRHRRGLPWLSAA